jgi:hypothetical protein
MLARILRRLAGGLVSQVVTEVGYVVLEGREPFDLIAQRLPSAVAANGIVMATVPIYAPRFPGNTAALILAPKSECAFALRSSCHSCRGAFFG